MTIDKIIRNWHEANFGKTDHDIGPTANLIKPFGKGDRVLSLDKVNTIIDLVSSNNYILYYLTDKALDPSSVLTDSDKTNLGVSSATPMLITTIDHIDANGNAIDSNKNVMSIPDTMDGFYVYDKVNHNVYKYFAKAGKWFAIFNIPLASTMVDGLMSKEDKEKIDTYPRDFSQHEKNILDLIKNGDSDSIAKAKAEAEELDNKVKDELNKKIMLELDAYAKTDQIDESFKEWFDTKLLPFLNGVCSYFSSEIPNHSDLDKIEQDIQNYNASNGQYDLEFIIDEKLKLYTLLTETQHLTDRLDQTDSRVTDVEVKSNTNETGLAQEIVDRKQDIEDLRNKQDLTLKARVDKNENNIDIILQGAKLSDLSKANVQDLIDILSHLQITTPGVDVTLTRGLQDLVDKTNHKQGTIVGIPTTAIESSIYQYTGADLTGAQQWNGQPIVDGVGVEITDIPQNSFLEVRLQADGTTKYLQLVANQLLSVPASSAWKGTVLVNETIESAILSLLTKIQAIDGAGGKLEIITNWMNVTKPVLTSINQILTRLQGVNVQTDKTGTTKKLESAGDLASATWVKQLETDIKNKSIEFIFTSDDGVDHDVEVKKLQILGKLASGTPTGNVQVYSSDKVDELIGNIKILPDGTSLMPHLIWDSTKKEWAIGKISFDSLANKDLGNVNVGVAKANKFLHVKADGTIEYIDALTPDLQTPITANGVPTSKTDGVLDVLNVKIDGTQEIKQVYGKDKIETFLKTLITTHDNGKGDKYTLWEIIEKNLKDKEDGKELDKTLMLSTRVDIDSLQNQINSLTGLTEKIFQPSLIQVWEVMFQTAISSVLREMKEYVITNDGAIDKNSSDNDINKAISKILDPVFKKVSWLKISPTPGSAKRNVLWTDFWGENQALQYFDYGIVFKRAMGLLEKYGERMLFTNPTTGGTNRYATEKYVPSGADFGSTYTDASTADDWEFVYNVMTGFIFFLDWLEEGIPNINSRPLVPINITVPIFLRVLGTPEPVGNTSPTVIDVTESMTLNIAFSNSSSWNNILRQLLFLEWTGYDPIQDKVIGNDKEQVKTFLNNYFKERCGPKPASYMRHDRTQPNAILDMISILSIDNSIIDFTNQNISNPITEGGDGVVVKSVTNPQNGDEIFVKPVSVAHTLDPVAKTASKETIEKVNNITVPQWELVKKVFQSIPVSPVELTGDAATNPGRSLWDLIVADPTLRTLDTDAVIATQEYIGFLESKVVRSVIGTTLLDEKGQPLTGSDSGTTDEMQTIADLVASGFTAAPSSDDVKNALLVSQLWIERMLKAVKEDGSKVFAGDLDKTKDKELLTTKGYTDDKIDSIKIVKADGTTEVISFADGTTPDKTVASKGLIEHIKAIRWDKSKIDITQADGSEEGKTLVTQNYVDKKEFTSSTVGNWYNQVWGAWIEGKQIFIEDAQSNPVKRHYITKVDKPSTNGQIWIDERGDDGSSHIVQVNKYGLRNEYKLIIK